MFVRCWHYNFHSEKLGFQHVLYFRSTGLLKFTVLEFLQFYLIVFKVRSRRVFFYTSYSSAPFFLEHYKSCFSFPFTYIFFYLFRKTSQSVDSEKRLTRTKIWIPVFEKYLIIHGYSCEMWTFSEQLNLKVRCIIKKEICHITL